MRPSAVIRQRERGEKKPPHLEGDAGAFFIDRF